METIDSTELELQTTQYRIIQLLNKYPESRDSDLFLLEKFYLEHEGKDVPLAKVTTPPSTIIRLRRLIQSKDPSLQGSRIVKELREKKAEKFRRCFSSSATGELSQNDQM